MKRKIKQLKLTQQLIYTSRLIFYYSLFAFLLANIVLSQSIPSLYFSVITEREDTTAMFLRKIRQLPQFDQILQEQEQLYGTHIRDVVFKEELSRRELISHLEYAYSMNPKATEVLYSLSKLYREEGNIKQADKYLSKALAIDPLIER